MSDPKDVLSRAILTYRENPTGDTYAQVMNAQREYVASNYFAIAQEYQIPTHTKAVGE